MGSCDLVEKHRLHFGEQVVMFAVKPSLLCLLTAHDTAGSGKIGIAKV